jgi:hypothetical protein
MRTVELSVVCDFKAREKQALIEQSAALLELGWTAEAHRPHDLGDQPQQRPTVLLAVLSCSDRVEQALPLGVLLTER